MLTAFDEAVGWVAKSRCPVAGKSSFGTLLSLLRRWISTSSRGGRVGFTKGRQVGKVLAEKELLLLFGKDSATDVAMEYFDRQGCDRAFATVDQRRMVSCSRKRGRCERLAGVAEGVGRGCGTHCCSRRRAMSRPQSHADGVVLFIHLQLAEVPNPNGTQVCLVRVLLRPRRDESSCRAFRRHHRPLCDRNVTDAWVEAEGVGAPVGSIPIPGRTCRREGSDNRCASSRSSQTRMAMPLFLIAGATHSVGKRRATSSHQRAPASVATRGTHHGTLRSAAATSDPIRLFRCLTVHRLSCCAPLFFSRAFGACEKKLNQNPAALNALFARARLPNDARLQSLV